MDLRADSWIALCNGDAVWLEDAREIALFHTQTARRLRIRLPKLRGYRIIGFSTGLLVLLHKSSAKVRVMHPFTHVAVDFPSLQPIYCEAINDRSSFRAMRAAICSAASSSYSIAVVIWFPYGTPVVVAAEAGSDRWEILHRNFHVRNTLVFQGRLYATMECSFEIVQLYPPTRRPPPLDCPAVVAHLPNIFGQRRFCDIFLVESGGRMQLVVRHIVVGEEASAKSAMEWWQQQVFTVYEMDLNNGCGRWKLTPVSSLGDCALFLNKDKCMSVSARDLPSLSRNSIYFSEPLHPLLMHSLTTRLTEDLAVECHDGEERIRPSVRPFTLADHLLTFCHPREWTKGLMLHEYHHIPASFRELRKSITAKELQQRFRHAQSNFSSESKKKQHAESTMEMAKLLATELNDATTSLAESTRMLAESTNSLVEPIRDLKDELMGLVCRMKQNSEGKDSEMTTIESNR